MPGPLVFVRSTAQTHTGMNGRARFHQHDARSPRATCSIENWFLIPNSLEAAGRLTGWRPGGSEEECEHHDRAPGVLADHTLIESVLAEHVPVQIVRR